MQNRYTADIGDYYKYGLMRALAPEHRLGLAWYLHPDEHNIPAGKHVGYLDKPEKWRDVDRDLFDAMKAIVDAAGPDLRDRNIVMVENSNLLENCVFANEPLNGDGATAPHRAEWRRAWFRRTVEKLAGCDVVFTDPDNGLCDDDNFFHSQKSCWKRMPLAEAQLLWSGRTGVLYHHNSRHKGGHGAEIDHWLERLPKGTMALRCRAYSARTYFVVNPTPIIRKRVEDFAHSWPQAKLHPIP